MSMNLKEMNRITNVLLTIGSTNGKITIDKGGELTHIFYKDNTISMIIHKDDNKFLINHSQEVRENFACVIFQFNTINGLIDYIENNFSSLEDTM